MAVVKKIKGRKWRSDSPIKGILNEIAENRTICFCEKQKDETEDRAELRFILRENQYGEYAEEYLPDTVNGQGRKVIDITALLVDETEKKGIWYLLDVKKDVGGEDVVFKLMEQWKCSYQYLRNSILNYIPEIEFSNHLGVVTRNFDEQRIRKTIELKKKVIHDCDGKIVQSIAGAKKRNENIKLKQEIKFLSDFLNRNFAYKDSLETVCFTFEIILEHTKDEKEYKSEIEMRLDK